jgi:hypothetical protein
MPVLRACFDKVSPRKIRSDFHFLFSDFLLILQLIARNQGCL